MHPANFIVSWSAAKLIGGGSSFGHEDCSRIAPAFLARERIRLGDALFRQEYHCEFIASPGSVFSAEILSAMFAEAEGQEFDENAPPQAANGTSRFVF